MTRGGGATWAIVVHGRGATRQEGLRILPTLTNLGMTAMVITYRNDRESIHDPNGQYGYGATEWPDLQAAVDYALAHGARDVVLYGYSLGGAITTSFLEHSDRASRVRRRARRADARLLPDDGAGHPAHARCSSRCAAARATRCRA